MSSNTPEMLPRDLFTSLQANVVKIAKTHAHLKLLSKSIADRTSIEQEYCKKITAWRSRTEKRFAISAKENKRTRSSSQIKAKPLKNSSKSASMPTIAPPSASFKDQLKTFLEYENQWVATRAKICTELEAALSAQLKAIISRHAELEKELTLKHLKSYTKRYHTLEKEAKVLEARANSATKGPKIRGRKANTGASANSNSAADATTATTSASTNTTTTTANAISMNVSNNSSSSSDSSKENFAHAALQIQNKEFMSSHVKMLCTLCARSADFLNEDESVIEHIIEIWTRKMSQLNTES